MQEILLLSISNIYLYEETDKRIKVIKRLSPLLCDYNIDAINA